MSKRTLKKLRNLLTTEQQQSLYQKIIQRQRADSKSANIKTVHQYDIAIIGLSGRFPQAGSHHEFWNKLLNGTNFIQEVPLDRWNHAEYHDSRLKSFVPHKTRCKFGAFLKNHDAFDASFFDIHTDEVPAMDPQERLALETTWACIEDAGYTAAGLGHQVGIFSGITYSEYQKLVPFLTHSYMLNNRIAYYFNFQGPTVTTDAGCCSSLAAIDLACKSLLKNECQAALVIGANTILHPDHYTSLSSMLSATPQPYSNPFGIDDGWIPAEGVVSILLKPLKKALEDRDHIYAVIKSGHLRQEGRTAWFTALNPKQQAKLIQENFEKSGINPETISYVEAAANGSSLGDAIEMEGLTAAFRQFTQKKQFCPVGSVKSNVGHGEGVSTLLQLTKILLQFKSKTLIPLLNLTETNPNIKIENSPFYFQKTTLPWAPPVVELNGKNVIIPRRATLSSFGAGGAMGHLILEEHVAEDSEKHALDSYFIPVSAKTAIQLRQTVENHITFFDEYKKYDPESESKLALLDMMFTLCTGRVPFKERIVFIVKNLEELIQQFQRFLNGENHPDIVSGNKAGPTITETENNQERARRYIENRSWHDLAKLWVQGFDISWGPFFNSFTVRRMPLPTYCFQRKSFPIPKATHPDKAKGSLITNTDIDHTNGDQLNGDGEGREPVFKNAKADDKIAVVFKEIFSKALDIPVRQIDVSTPLEKYGFDSAMVISAANDLETYFRNVPKTLFFECRTIQDVMGHFMKKYPDEIRIMIQKTGDIASSERVFKKYPLPRLEQGSAGSRIKPESAGSKDIAIIGLAGRYPRAKNIDEFWQNLKAGRDCISEIPPERWKWQDYFHADPHEAAASRKSYSKWGGFLDNVDHFDPLFFNISPREAEYMDPQERLFLEVAWEVLEDAGYSRTLLKADQSDDQNMKVGVFVGASWQEYQLYSGAVDKDKGIILSTNAYNIANRVSYFCDFKGSSLSVDTACSSSLTAIHLACQSLIDGTNAMAIGGGVNLSLHPNKYLALSTGQFISSKGRCESFGEGGDGYVPGEGVGAVLLKPLSKAIEDGDHIYGVIKATVINHGGKTNGYSVPDPNAQASVIGGAFKEAGVHPRMVSYIEAHGTGTALGDPIEIAGLTKAFQEYTGDKQFCAIGSAKSNIGHCESAAGIAGLTKILLQLKYRQLAPSLHARTLNPNIDFESTPFVVQQEPAEWKRPVIEINGETREYPRIAGISSFGAGGSNAHVVIEEYISQEERTPIPITPENPAIIVLSAKNEERLKEQISRLLAAIRERQLTDGDLADMAYTLQVGREAMEERLGVTAASIKDLEEKLKNFIAGREYGEDLYRGHVKHNKDTPAVFAGDDDMAKTIDAWITKRKYEKLLDLWAKGLIFDWNKLYGDVRLRRISLPTYPFARERHWPPEIKEQGSEDRGRRIHPLLLGNISDEQDNVRRQPDAATMIQTSLEEEQQKPLSQAEEAFKLMTFEEVWREQGLPDKASVNVKTMVCFLSNREDQQGMIDAMQALDQQTKIIFISQGAAYKKQSQQEYSIRRTDRNTYEDAFQNIREYCGEADAIFYLWPLEDASCIQDYSSIVYILQAVASAKLKPKRFLLAAQFDNGLDRCYLESWIGFERSLGLVLPNTHMAAILGEQSREGTIKDWTRRLWLELQAPKVQSVLYRERERHICRIQPTTIRPGDGLLKSRATYLITGGCGGLGLLFAEHLAKKYSVNLILTGRSPLDEEKQSKLNALEEVGGRVLYVQADVCDPIGMKAGLSQAKERFGRIHGVIHAAGIGDNQSVLEKDIQSFQNVLDPKIKGALLLDELLREEDLDFICYFSSSSAILGDFGSCDYAIGNRFLTAYAHYRNEQERRGLLQGKAIVINWPLWKDGGMGSGDDENTGMYLKSSGQRLLETGEGLAMFERILSQNGTQHLVLVGQPGRVKRFLGLIQRHLSSSLPLVSSSSHARKGRRVEMSGLSVEQCLEWDLKEHISRLLKISGNQLKREKNFADFGFDSVTLAEFARLLVKHYRIEITPALFYGHSTLEKLIYYFLKEHQDAVNEFYREDVPEQAIPQAVAFAAPAPKRQRAGKPRFAARDDSEPVPEPIAIIGMSGRFPGADTIKQFWNNLKDGAKCISEIPADRWDWREYYGDPDKPARKTNSKWGGFMNHVDRFDPLFFEISPKEAEVMDPRQRLFLQEAWHALEDAAYMGERIKGKSCGVYVGVEEGEYGFWFDNYGLINSNQNATLSARIAYTLDLKGPNLALTASCSSGLVAVHQACHALRQGDCDLALVGGVSLLISPMTHLMLSQAGMLSPDENCYVFDQRAKGLVPGEAVAVVLLKPLSKAIADNDQIYGSIKASGVNYDGRSNGITAPNLLSQAELIASIYDKYRIDPEYIHYVISHSVGSRLGDPIEIQALTNAFGTYTDKKQYSSVGSIKPLIGHTFAASGIVSLIAMLQSMKNRVIPATHNFESANEYINFKTSPFILNKENQAWAAKDNHPRLGAISTTGISGTNAHAVIEEYVPLERKVIPVGSAVSPKIIIFSAKNQDRLLQVARQMLEFLNDESSYDLHLSDIAYTLQTGREAMKERLAIPVSSKEELLKKLETFISLSRDHFQENSIFYGNADNYRTADPNPPLDPKACNTSVETALEEGDVDQLSLMWVKGAAVPWERLNKDKHHGKISLPAYPFVEKRCWIDRNQTSDTEERHTMNTFHREYENKAAEFYTFAAKGSKKDFNEEYLTYCPFEEKVPGFSLSRVFLHPETCQDDLELVKTRQIEMRQVLFCKEDFNRIHTLFDIGCGHGTDIIQIAMLYPHMRTHGFTITQAQADLGNQRIAQKNLSSRAKIYHKDSSKDIFPDRYDLIIGIEVTCHIRNKQGLFQNIASSLNEGGRVLLMDFIANLRGPIIDPNVEISIPTVQGWIETLAQNSLLIHEIIDVTPHIANFLYDPECEKNIKDFPKVVQDSLRNYTNNAVSLEKGWLSYCLFKLKKDTTLSHSECRNYNADKISRKTPYRRALEEMRSRGHIPYPQNKKKPEGTFLNRQEKSSVKNPQSGSIEAQGRIYQEAAEIRKHLSGIFRTVLKLQQEELEQADTFHELGIGSINAVELLEAINAKFDLGLPTSVVLEFNTLDALARYIAELQGHHGKQDADGNQEACGITDELPEQHRGRGKTGEELIHENESHPVLLRTDDRKFSDDIAIIGLSCRCAGADDQYELWDLVRQGKDCIREINNKHWTDFFTMNSPQKVPCRYGAMDNIEFFDPFFFNISPKEAESMDPSQRILLQECYTALEDAGYTPSLLRGQQVGTVIGTMGGSPLKKDLSHLSMLGCDTSILAARIAYFLDLKGPALAVNTACSSSLAAIDIAIQKLKSREISLAIAGGITLHTHPGLFVAMNNAGMLSPSGECRPFDNAANGIVVGDGVGVVILKRLQDAQRDDDDIYGIIRGSGTNQDGQTSGMTVPSFLSQSQLQESIYRKNCIDVEQIQYVEAHGTGTRLGDPVEIHALNDSFAKFTAKKRFCAIGSLKANIGHTTAAAGVLSLIKVLLSLKNNQIPPLINFVKGNEHIDFDNSPLYVNTSLKDWPANSKRPRLAAISSFGFSGTNAHLVVEEYVGNSRGSVARIDESAPGLLLLSAEREEGLRQYAKEVKEFIQRHDHLNLSDLLYTFLVARESLSHRLAFVAGSKEILLAQLEQFVEGRGAKAGERYAGKIGREKGICIGDTEEGKEYIEKLVRHKKIAALAELWVNGNRIEWEMLHQKGSVRRLAGLPTYPFGGERYWISDFETKADSTKTCAADAAFIHPLLHQNTSDFSEQRYTSRFMGEEFFLADYVVKGSKILPRAAYLEMAREAVERAAGAEGSKGIRLKNVVWAHPIAVNGRPVRIHIGLFPEDNGEISYEIYSQSEENGAEPNVHSRGEAVLGPVADAAALDIQAVQAECGHRTLSSDQCYEAFRAMGFEYGPGHRGLENILVGSNKVLARLRLPPSVSATKDQFILHPCIMDSALQACSGFMNGLDSPVAVNPVQPFALQELEVLGECTASMWALIRYNNGSKPGDTVQKFDLDLSDEQGIVRVRMRGICCQATSEASPSRRSLKTTAVPEAGFSARSEKPREIYLRPLPDQLLSFKPEEKSRKLISLSSTCASASQPKSDRESKPVPSVQTTIPEESLRKELTTSLAEALCMKEGDIDIDKKFVDMGLDSIIGVEWLRVINEQYVTSIAATKIYDYPTIREFTEFLAKELIERGGGNGH